MKRIAFISVIVMLIAANSLFAQKKGDKLKVETGLFKNKYYHGVWNISQDKAINMLSENGESYALINKGIKLQRTFRIVAGAGTAMVLYSAISAAAGAEDPRWYIAGIGGGAILVSIPIYSTGHKKAHESIEVYNEEVLSQKITQRPLIDQVSLFSDVSGIGVRLTF